MSGSVPPVPPPGTIPVATPNARDAAPTQSAETAPPRSGNQPPQDTLQTVARVPHADTAAALPEALLTVPSETVIEGLVATLPQEALPRVETNYGAVAADTSVPLADGQAVNLQVQSVSVQAIAAPVALDGRLPPRDFPPIVTLAAVVGTNLTEIDAALEKLVDGPRTSSALTPPSPVFERSEPLAEALPRIGLPPAIADLPVGARIAGTVLPVAVKGLQKLLLVTQDAVLELAFPARNNRLDLTSGGAPSTPRTGAHLLLELRGLAQHINARLISQAGVPVSGEPIPVILRPPVISPPRGEAASGPNHANSVRDAASLTGQKGLVVGEAIPAVVQNGPARPDAVTSAGVPASHMAATPVTLVLRSFGDHASNSTTLSLGALVFATVTGHDHQGQLLLSIGGQTLRAESSAPFPPGTVLTFEVLPPPPPALSPPSPVAGSVSPAPALDTLLQAVQAVAVADPHAQSATAATISTAGTGAFAKFIAHLFALKSGDARQWLGERAAAVLERLGRGALLGRIGEEFRLVERGLADTTSEWRQLPLPVHDGDRLGIVTAWLYDPRRGRGDDADAEAEKETHLVVDLTLSRLGDIRLDGFYRPGRFDLAIASALPFEDPVRYNMIQLFDDVMAVSGLTGTLTFRAHAAIEP